VALTIARLPIQSLALRPAMIGVDGISNFKNCTKVRNTKPEHGTREVSTNFILLSKIFLTSDIKTPYPRNEFGKGSPRTGPTAAAFAHIKLSSPNARLRYLTLNNHRNIY
jgi:hypothetical protein